VLVWKSVNQTAPSLGKAVQSSTTNGHEFARKAGSLKR
jgi:hypothetical protein